MSLADRFSGFVRSSAAGRTRQQRRSLDRRRRREARSPLSPESLEARALLAVVVPGYEITQDWGSGFQAAMTLENRDTQAVANWTVSFDYSGEIGSIWDATVVDRDGDRYTVANAGWNGSLDPGRSVAFGFIGSGDSSPPTNYTLNGEPLEGVAPADPAPLPDPGPADPVDPVDPVDPAPVDPVDPVAPPETSATVDFRVSSDWGSGFTGEVTLADTAGGLADWRVSFEFAGEISSIWNAQIESRSGSTYVVKGAGWNADLAPGGQVSFGFTATPGGAAAVLTGLSAFAAGDVPGVPSPEPEPPVPVDPGPAEPDPVAPPADPTDPTPPADPVAPPIDESPIDESEVGLNSGNLGDEKWGEAYFAAYVDMGLWPVPDLTQIARSNGTSLLTLGFLQAAPDGSPAWAGLAALAPDSDFPQALEINASIDAFRAAGGDVMISLGGASGTTLAQAAVAAGETAEALAARYVAVVDAYDLNRLDFDIEGAAVAEPASIALRSEAIAILQAQRPDLEVWYTLPVLPSGLTPDGLNVVRSALEAGVKLDGVNVMAMNYGAANAPITGPAARSFGEYAIAAAESTHAQLTTLFAEEGQGFAWRMVGVTPMIGVNDLSSEVFTLEDARQLEDFAREKGVGMLSMWSVARDNPGSLGRATATASGLDLPAGSFSGVFNDYGTINELSFEGEAPPSDPAPSDPVDPAPSDPAPSDPAPSDPAPSDPVPADPVDQAPADPAPADPAPADPAPADPADPPPADPSPADPVDEGSDPAPIDPLPADPGEAAELPIAATDKVLAAYFPEWGIYGRDYQLDDVPGEKITHLIYAFADLTAAGEMTLFDSYAAVEKRFSADESVSGEADQWYYPPDDPRSEQTVWGNFNQLAQLKEKYPHLRVSIAVGGWTLSTHFSSVTATAEGRTTFADSIVEFLTTYEMFDGVDFDWEYPGGGGLGSNTVSPNDGANYAKLLAEVRTKIDILGAQRGRSYEISVASPGGLDKIANFNLPGLTPSVDFFNLMSYDFHGTWESTTGHQAAFTGDPAGYDIQTAVNAYLEAGVPAEKIVLGAPLYTRGWSGVADGGDGGYLEPASGGAPGSFETGVYDYKDLLAQVQDPASGWQIYWDDNAQASYVYNAAEDLFSSFETPTSIALKAQWAEEMGLGGMMFWDLSNDATDSPESLVDAAFRSLVAGEDLETIQEKSSLDDVVVVGGDGVVAPLPLG